MNNTITAELPDYDKLTREQFHDYVLSVTGKVAQPSEPVYDPKAPPFVPSYAGQATFLKAFAAAQTEYLPVVRDKLVTVRPKDQGKAPYQFMYAELEKIIAATAALQRHGISVAQPVHDDGEFLWLYTILAHEDGGGRITRIKLAFPDEMKAFGGDITYLRRYMLAPALGIASEDDADENGDFDRDEYDDTRRPPPPPPAPRAPERKSAAAKPPATDKPAGKPADTAGIIKPGQVKYLNQKVEALKLDADRLAEVLGGLNIPAISERMTLAQFEALNKELDRVRDA